MHGEQSTWWSETHDDADESARIAYFSMEFGIEESLPIYSGGLGVLAGDHLKAAAELGVPLVGVGLLYRGGYFTQGIDDAGRQTEEYERVDPEALGLHREDVTVEVELDSETISANVWRKDVGSVPLYLLEVEMLTDALYSGDREHRIRQELLLGVGGVRALEALGVDANVFHMNEGHSAFLAIERIRSLVQNGMSTDDAIAHVKALHRLHHPHPRPRRQRDLRHRADPPLRRAARERGRHHRGVPALARRVRRGRSVRAHAHVAAPLRLRERRLRAARRGRARDVVVARERRHRDRPRHERRPPRHLARPGAQHAAPRGPASTRPLRPTTPAGRTRPTSTRRSSGTSTTPPSASSPS